MDTDKERALGSHEKKNTTKVLNRTNHLLLIAIDKYKNNIQPLSNAVRDAKAFRDVLLNKYQLDKNNITSLIDSRATKKAIIKAFDKLLDTLTENDNLIIYFSGHGELIDRKNKDKGYWVPADAVLDERDTYLANEEIRDFFSNLDAHHVLGIIDSCFSGSLLLRSLGKVAQRYYNIPSRWIMTSGMKEPVSDGSGKHSPFAASLLAQLKNSTQNAIGVSYLWNSMREGVISNAKQTPLCQPIMDVGHQGGEFFFLANGVENVPEEITQDAGGSTKQVKAETPVEVIEPVVEESKTITDLATLQTYYRELLLDNNYGDVIELLKNNTRKEFNFYAAILINASAYNRLEKQMAKGLVRDPDFEYNKLSNKFFTIIDEIKEKDLIDNIFPLTT